MGRRKKPKTKPQPEIPKVEMLDGVWSVEDRPQVIIEIKDILWRYLYKYGAPEIQVALNKLSHLETRQHVALSVIHFLLSNEVKDFLDNVPEILNRFMRSTKKDSIMFRGIIRGNIDWGKTLATRYSQGFDDPTLFVCKPSYRIYNLPQNQLVKYLLHQIPKLADSSQKFIPNVGEMEDFEENWLVEIKRRKHLALEFAQYAQFRTIDCPNKIPSYFLGKMRNVRAKCYVTAIRCFITLDDVVFKMKKDRLRQLIEDQIIAPLSHDQLFELLVMFRTIQGLERTGWSLGRMGLIKPSIRSICKFSREARQADVYYQNVVLDLKESHYKEFFELYDIDSSFRRGDLIIKFSNPEQYIVLFSRRIKRKREIAAAMYEIFGYMDDFGSFFHGKRLNAILVIWGGLTKSIMEKIARFEHNLVVTGYDNLAETINLFLTLKSLETVKHKMLESTKAEA